MIPLDLLETKYRFAVGALAIDMSFAVTVFAFLQIEPSHKAVAHGQKFEVFGLSPIDAP